MTNFRTHNSTVDHHSPVPLPQYSYVDGSSQSQFHECSPPGFSYFQSSMDQKLDQMGHSVEGTKGRN